LRSSGQSIEQRHAALSLFLTRLDLICGKAQESQKLLVAASTPAGIDALEMMASAKDHLAHRMTLRISVLLLILGSPIQ
jgi:hypothetical protein